MATSPTILIDVIERIVSSDTYGRERTLFVDEVIGCEEEREEGGNPEEKVVLSEDVEVIYKHWLNGIIPTLDIFSWNPDYPSPSGKRHAPFGAAAFDSVVSDLGYLDFGISDIDFPGTTNTRVITLKVTPQSGVFSVTNLRLWKFSDADLGSYEDDFSINFEARNEWVQGSGLPSGIGEILPASLPESQNIFRQDGSEFIDGSNTINGRFPPRDTNVSQYVYLSVNVGGSFEPGDYGEGGTGSVGLRLTYDYFPGNYHEVEPLYTKGRLLFG